jgi:hypothetical protein
MTSALMGEAPGVGGEERAGDDVRSNAGLAVRLPTRSLIQPAPARWHELGLAAQGSGCPHPAPPLPPPTPPPRAPTRRHELELPAQLRLDL